MRRRIFFVGLGLILLLALGLFVVRARNRALLDRQLHAIEERGEPVVLPLAAATQSGAETLAWLKHFEEPDDADGEWELRTTTGVQRFLDQPEGRALRPEDRTRLERLAECLRPDPRWGDVVGAELEAHAVGVLVDGLQPDEWDACVREFILTRELAYLRLQPLLLKPVPEAPLDAEGGLGLERIPKHLPSLSAASRALLVPVYPLAVHGAAPEIVARVTGTLHVAALSAPRVGLINLQFRCLIVGRTLRVLRAAVAQLSPDANLDSIAPLLLAIEDERVAFRRALCEERAIGNECYGEYLPSNPQLDTPWGGFFPALLSFDQPYYLSAFEEALAAADLASPAETQKALLRLEARLRDHSDSWRAYTAPVALHLLPRFTDTLRCLRDQRAWIELVRSGLRVRSLAREAALADVAATRDPYSAAALHARMETDGLLTIWSVGPNGRDDGAPRELELLDAEEGETSARETRDDLVLRVRMR